ncbi:hypothetical protein ElyMa_005837200 [Elysia marginata]|uniref:Uncharacterized protein n=1 Tax=Elysia marginata TaxID=1093978 RepID=A0AAV4FXE5_9GAST|nr:hypothetical protein ElyMa_005837200 [Elysia marginata]
MRGLLPTLFNKWRKARQGVVSQRKPGGHGRALVYKLGGRNVRERGCKDRDQLVYKLGGRNVRERGCRDRGSEMSQWPAVEALKQYSTKGSERSSEFARKTSYLAAAPLCVGNGTTENPR